MDEKTTIQISKKNKNKLLKLASVGETHNDVISKLLKKNTSFQAEKRAIEKIVKKNGDVGSVILPVKFVGKNIIVCCVNIECVSLIKRVKSGGNSGRVNVPKSWINEKVLVYLLNHDV